MEATKKQYQTLNNHTSGHFFKCPDCGSEWVGVPMIENPGEETTQIFCLYGCGFIFLPETK
jgi:hypothetical protein